MIIGVLVVFWLKKEQSEKHHREKSNQLAEEIALKESQIEGQKISLKSIFNQSQQERRTVQKQRGLIEEMKKTLQHKIYINTPKDLEYLVEKIFKYHSISKHILRPIQEGTKEVLAESSFGSRNGSFESQPGYYVNQVPKTPPIPANYQRGESEKIIHHISLERKSKDTLDSINYARQIQDAILPKLEVIHKVLPESFILFKPRDIVSGDFYWFDSKNHRTIIAAIDCTGHGVPGLF